MSCLFTCCEGWYIGKKAKFLYDAGSAKDTRALLHAIVDVDFIQLPSST